MYRLVILNIDWDKKIRHFCILQIHVIRNSTKRQIKTNYLYNVVHRIN